mgnify:CR=1 FL=1
MTKQNPLQGELWTEDDDIKLAECVLRRVREGDSVVDACREFEDMTNGRRTAQAAKFHWHTKLRHRYSAAYELAKQEGKKNRELKRRKINQGERYKDIMETVFDSEPNREILIDDILVLVKKFKEQEEAKGNFRDQYEKETNKLRRENEKIAKQLKQTEDELERTKEALVYINNQYNKLLNALKVLKEAGIQINIPEPDDFHYVINKDGTVDKL